MFSPAASCPQPVCRKRTGEPTKSRSSLLTDVARMVRAEDAQVAAEFDDLLAVARVLAEALTGIRAALEGVSRHGVQGVARGAVREPAPAPDASAAAETARHGDPARDGARGKVDPEDLADHLAVAVRTGPEVDRAVDECERPPHELAPEVAVDGHGPAAVLRSRRQVERVDTAEGVGDVDRVCGEVDHGRPAHAVAVDLLADALQLAQIDSPADIAVLGQRVHEPARRRDVDRLLARAWNVLGDEHLGADPPGDRRVPGGPNRRWGQRLVGERGPGRIVPVAEPAARRLRRCAAPPE